MKTSLKERILIIALLLLLVIGMFFAFFFENEGKMQILRTIENYQELLESRRKGKDETEPPILDDYPKVQGIDCYKRMEGFNFDEVRPVNDYLYVRILDSHIITDGENIYDFADSYDLVTNNLTINTILDDKYVYTSNNMIGIKKISGEIVVDALDCDRIDFFRDTAIAIKQDLYTIFYKSTLLDSTSKRVTLSTKENFIKIDGMYYNASDKNFSLNKPIVMQDVIKNAPSNYILMSPPQDVFMFFDTKTMLFGYADATQKTIVLEPRFKTAEEFVDGYAMAYDDNLKCDYYLSYIDNALNMSNLGDYGIKTRDNFNNQLLRIFPFYNDYAIFYDTTTSMHGIFDTNFKIVSTMFKNPYPKVLSSKTPVVFDLDANKIFYLDGRPLAPNNNDMLEVELFTNNLKTETENNFYIYKSYYNSNSYRNNTFWIFDKDFKQIDAQLSENIYVDQFDFAYYFSRTKALFITIDDSSCIFRM